eukprot:NODE_2522_length_919_cov_639.127315.p1 GENE.NODE_2522_length_919_cov_639.127315~~NODE_2522_length_919_cov_639.127315.p1  ORF type:complete len:262 (-),score=86.51 NODE_2522_length_919_cov_639.127315:116-862(-)
MILLTLIVYLFAVVFTHAFCEEMRLACSDVCSEELFDGAFHEYWGSLPKSMLTLAQVTTSGVDWGEPADPLISLGIGWLFLFLLYITFYVFAVLNVVTAAFCQKAIESANIDPDSVIVRNLEARSELVARLRLFFAFLSDGVHSITASKFVRKCTDELIQAYFEGFGVESTDAQALFDLLDTDGDGLIEEREFVEGCAQLQGQARSLDLALLSNQVKNLLDPICQLLVGHQVECAMREELEGAGDGDL